MVVAEAPSNSPFSGTPGCFATGADAVGWKSQSNGGQQAVTAPKENCCRRLSLDSKRSSDQDLQRLRRTGSTATGAPPGKTGKRPPLSPPFSGTPGCFATGADAVGWKSQSNGGQRAVTAPKENRSRRLRLDSKRSSDQDLQRLRRTGSTATGAPRGKTGKRPPLSPPWARGSNRTAPWARGSNRTVPWARGSGRETNGERTACLLRGGPAFVADQADESAVA
ncbi:hypothetical protein Pan216_09080 [Planctomycetes bacterium Pan216]|uniref:Uncharacterized protein n=1 Tax=Kolteria novifilia TaxID=2527975 RepID=A0A518AZE1_9BACT|nr:hypothetical protein Pan216_09080 [Planctomycetes bacterium Pan216]